jgi:hypothetical protein
MQYSTMAMSLKKSSTQALVMRRSSSCRYIHCDMMLTNVDMGIDSTTKSFSLVQFSGT